MNFSRHSMNWAIAKPRNTIITILVVCAFCITASVYLSSGGSDDHALAQNRMIVQLQTQLRELQQQLRALEETGVDSGVQPQHQDKQQDRQKTVISGGGFSNEHQNLLFSGSRRYPVVPKLVYGEQKRILVTGGAGFVGSHLVDVLMLQGHQVIVLDNMFTGRKQNVQHWFGHPNFELIVHDVVQPYMAEVDQIYHLACPASPPHYQYNPIKTIKTSVQGTLNMLGLAKRVEARILFTSTSEVYGDPQVHPQSEAYWGNVNPIGPRACYDEGKRVGETMCYSYMHQSGVEVRVARIFNTFGPRMHPNDGRVVSNFIVQSLKGEPLTVYGDGEQTRSFQYVRDLVIGLVKLMNSDLSDPCNLGNPVETSIIEFAKRIKGVLKSDKEILHMPPATDDPSKRKPDISRARKELGWQPTTSVAEGLEYTIEYFKQELSMSKAHTEIWLDDQVLVDVTTNLVTQK